MITVTTLLNTPSSLPALIVAISRGSAANAPTISNSGLFGSNPCGLAGNLSLVSIGRVDDELYPFDNFA